MIHNGLKKDGFMYYPTLVQTPTGPILAMFTQSDMDRAIKRAKKYSHITEELFKRIKKARQAIIASSKK